ncbi:hypothetical protein BDR07DRAFT_1494136 [Suillus spraguei]|nr:hypothetical protein BDR07DRAFT_1494136 [Suillus spraguei]
MVVTQSWISGVNKSFKPHTPSTHKSSTSVPPSTIFSRLTGTSEVTVESVALAKTTKKSGDVLVGGFDDEEEEDDSLECQLARSMVKKGKGLATTTVGLTLNESDASAYIEPPFTQSSEAWPMPRPKPVSKRKAADILEVSSTSEIEDFDATASDCDLLSDIDDYSMEVDSTHSDLKPETSQPAASLKQDPVLLMRTLSKSQDACHTTDSVRTQFSNEFSLTHITYYSELSPYYTSERTCIISRMIWASGPWAHGRNILVDDGWAGRNIIPDDSGWAHARNM